MDNNQKIFSPVVLLIIDGWGLTPGWGGNAILASHPTNFNYYWRNYPHAVLKSLSLIADTENQVSNYRFAYSMLSSGKILQPPSQIISNQIQNGLFFQNNILKKIFEAAITEHKKIHLVGNISNDNHVSNIDHLIALINFAKNEGASHVFVHAILDSAKENNKLSLGILNNLNDQLLQSQIATLATFAGKNWVENKDFKKIRQFFSNLFDAGVYCTNFEAQIATYYKKKIADVNLPPTTVLDYQNSNNRIENGDYVLFFNFDNSKITYFIELFAKSKKSINTILLSQEPNINLDFIIPNDLIQNSLSEIIAKNNLNQVKIYESLQKENLTAYFNGSNTIFSGEKRIEIGTVPTKFSRWPQMSSIEIKEEAKKAILSNKFDFVLVSLANVDYLARLQNLNTLMQAIIIADKVIADLAQTTLSAGGTFMMTATHGNAEQTMDIQNISGSFHNQYSLNPVPLIEVNEFNNKDISRLSQNLISGSIVSEMMIHNYTIADITPTILHRLNIPIPQSMTGKNLEVLKK